MNKKLALPLLVSALLALAGCGKNEAPAANDAGSSSSSAASASNASATVTVELTANDQMKFNLNRIEAKPGQEVKVTLTNTGTQPKTVMGHNFVLLTKGADAKAFTDAAVTAAATDYIPDSQKDKVVAHTKLLGAKQSDEITFKAPTEPGEYIYLCTFPGHFAVGMQGVLVVK